MSKRYHCEIEHSTTHFIVGFAETKTHRRVADFICINARPVFFKRWFMSKKKIADYR